MAHILAYDNCFNLCNVAFKKSNNDVEEISEINGFQNLVPNIKRLVKEACINEIRFTLGPGSFTGLRIGIATALGMQAVNMCQLIGCSTFDLLLQQVISSGKYCFKNFEDISIVVDAKRNGVVYFSKITIDEFMNNVPNPELSWLQNTVDLDALTIDSTIITNHRLLYHKLKSDNKIYIDKIHAVPLLSVPVNRLLKEIKPIYFQEIS